MSVCSENKKAESARELRRDYPERKTDILTDLITGYFYPNFL
jgi:hypothetical protein